jgi:diguanylate cyclase (GGDEF)-like protein
LRNINDSKIDQERLEYLSMHDQLTGIHNRTYFNAVLQGKEGRLEPPVSVIVLDFDELKKVNDSYGHAAGDEALKACTELIKSVLRKNDIFARVGGDEFTILLPGAAEESAELVIKRIYSKIEAFNLLGRLPPISISAGAAVCDEPLDGYEVRTVIPSLPLEGRYKKADERMYTQKREKKRAQRKK